jgi:hypothetical protein
MEEALSMNRKLSKDPKLSIGLKPLEAGTALFLRTLARIKQETEFAAAWGGANAREAAGMP